MSALSDAFAAQMRISARQGQAVSDLLRSDVKAIRDGRAPQMQYGLAQLWLIGDLVEGLSDEEIDAAFNDETFNGTGFEKPESHP